MSDQRTVSDLVFRDLAPDPSPTLDRDEAWEALVREELGKLRPSRPAPRVVPAAQVARDEPQPASAE